MEKLPEVATASALMTEAMTWSVMKWLREKKAVRKTADEANAALDRLHDAVRQRWANDLRAAYESLAPGPGRNGNKRQNHASANDSEASLIARKIKAADDEAYRARMDAEQTFDEAERQLSTSLAREGCRKAIQAWELQQKAILKAEAVIRPK